MCDDEGFFGFLFGIAATIFVFVIIFSGTDNGSVIEQLDLSEDKIAREYVLGYYPEYENCSFEWKEDLKADCMFCDTTPGVRIYCQSLDNRDGLRVLREKNPTEEIEFEDVKLNDILTELLSEYR